jgi:hypothetical protein
VAGAVGGRGSQAIAASLVRDRADLPAVQVANEAVELVGDLGEVLVGAAAEFRALRVEARDELGMLVAQKRRLAPLDFGENHQVVLEILDGFFEIGHGVLVRPWRLIFSWRLSARLFVTSDNEYYVNL